MTDKPATQSTNPESRKLGLAGLVAVVIGSMIGGGLFNLPQNMASGAGLIAVFIAWVVTGVGMYFLANSFRILADEKPNLNTGIYAYARHGFGKFVGFEMAWGYWLSAAFGNVAFAVLVMQTLNYFWPVFGDGRNWQSVLGGSLLIWSMNFLVLRGVRQASSLNVVATIAKIVPIILILIVTAIAAHWDQFTFDAWGNEQGLGPIVDQVKSTMMVTLWVFIGIEGAVVISGRARKPEMVGSATLIGLIASLTIYALISLLPFGIMSQEQLSALPNPSSAYILDQIIGGWGAVVVNLGLLISVLGCWLAWTILVAEVPFAAACDGVFPKSLSHENKQHTPAPALWLSSIVMQVTIFVVLFANDAWIFLISITGVMVLPPYVASTLYLCKLAFAPQFKTEGISSRNAAITTAVLGTIYSLWLLYAAGPVYFLMSTIVYALGIPVFWWARRSWEPDAPVFHAVEKIFAILMTLTALIAIYLFASGNIGL